MSRHSTATSKAAQKARSIPATGCSIDGSSSYSLLVSRSAQGLQEIRLKERIGERLGASRRCGGDVTFAFDRWLHTAQFPRDSLKRFTPQDTHSTTIGHV